MKCCEQCTKEFEPYVGRQRFCCRACSDAWWQQYRSEAVAERRDRDRGASTYFEHALADADAPGGRFAGPSANVVGTAPTVEPLACPAWARDLASLPDEPPLGECVDDIGEALGGAGGGT